MEQVPLFFSSFNDQIKQTLKIKNTKHPSEASSIPNSSSFDQTFMASTLQHVSRILLLACLASLASSQGSNNQNIQVPFPSISTPAFSNPPPSSPPPTSTPAESPFTSSTPSKESGSNKTTKVAIATGASSFALSFIVFYLFHSYSLKKHMKRPVVQEPEKGRYGSMKSDRINGMIVDENGLDVLYWRDLVGGARCNYCNCLYDQSVDPSLQVSLIDKGNPRYKHGDKKVQKTPLLPSNSERSSAYEYAASDSNRTSSASLQYAGIASNVPPPKAPSQPPPKAPSPPPPKAPSPPPPKAPSPPPPPPPPPKADPPLTLPPKAPPLPPPPMMKKNTGPPPPMPPRPPPSKNSNMAVPSPPPLNRSSGGSSSRPPLLPPPPENGAKTRAKLKPLHWDKVTPPNADHSMVWDRISDGSFKIDDDLMDTLFGYKATNLASSKTTPSTSSPPIPSQICLLDPRKSQNIAIIIRSLNTPRHEILDSLTQGKGLTPDILEKLSKISFTKEEQSTILNFSDNVTKLADGESFLHHLLKSVPCPFERVNAMLFRSTYDPEILHVKRCIQTLELACKEIKSHGLFLKLLEAILKAGNRMNAGTARGNAKAFNLTALCKLSDVKSTDGKTTLLHFVVEEVVRSEGKRLVINRNHSLRRSGSSSSNSNVSTSREEKEKEYIKLGLPVVGGVSEGLTNVKKAAAIDYDSLVSSCSSLGARMKDIRVFLRGCRNNDGFMKEMKGFLESSEEELRVVAEEQATVMETVKRTTEYYQPGSSKDKNAQPLQLFGIVKDFFVMFDKVCVDITRNMQKRTVVSGYSSARSKEEVENRIVARFPHLPPRFMTESSSGSDSEDEF